MATRQRARDATHGGSDGPAGAAATSQPIELQTALRLCRQVQDEVRGKWWRGAWWQCAGCRRFSGGDLQKMCIAAAPGYRGCALVNRRFDAGSLDAV